nr:MAG TPA: hypothetical protein [Caudoviricetes sp.]DAS51001.1 MAG TPA: hypothetical protein [Caudoviricetes sp.]
MFFHGPQGLLKRYRLLVYRYALRLLLAIF